MTPNRSLPSYWLLLQGQAASARGSGEASARGSGKASAKASGKASARGTGKALGAGSGRQKPCNNRVKLGQEETAQGNRKEEFFIH